MGFATSRRGFLRAASGLLVAVALPLKARAQDAAAAAAPAAPAIPPGAFIHIAPDDTVTVIVKHIEFGQGPLTGLATLVAEELDADWSQMRGALAHADDALYANLAFGMQGTGGSTALGNSFLQMRAAGAAVRQMLVETAAEEWGVPAAEIAVAKGRITHPSGKESGFGALADAAAQRPVPAEPALKSPDQWVLIGTDLPKLDTAEKSDGRAQFTLDLYPKGVQVVVIERPRSFGATVKSYDDTDAKQVAGVRAIRQLSQGVAVYADTTFAALKARAALKVDWDLSGAETRTSQALMAEMAAAAREPGRTVEESGDLSGLDAEGVTLVEAEYSFPYLAHAPMETLDGVITLSDGKAEAWYGCQFPGVDRTAIARTLGLPVESVRVNVLLAGGSFGRRAQGSAHFAIELAEVAKAGGNGSYKLMWTREDDIRGGYYRPMTVHRMRGAIDADGRIAAWENVVANQSIVAGTVMEMMMQDGLDPTAYEGSIGLPWTFGGHRVAWRRVDGKVPVLWWRSVGSTHTAMATEMFLDELLEAAGKDAVQGRLDLLKPEALRERAVIEAVRDMAGWQGSKRGDKAYGVAFAKSFGTYVAQIVEVESRDGQPHVTRAWCAVDCGIPVNPNIIRAQMEGGIGYGLGAILHSTITLGENGAVQEGNFDDYPTLRMGEMPRVEVTIIKSAEAPTGVGEPGVPPIGPAVANAWRALTGQRTRSLPMLQTGGVV
ncbi:xanthine dehydrogenase family protein molybdopterin-binding subunit [Paracoccus luteus]|uniref:xanthine dehydrogenase family protein molybdopterin-binding subunit n=1 Tax=Paracoccus luteus TaxID=2508543 RepID=UPI001070051B|nr:xanthine dehydrogenase family protein molybdopterin-binding subunit [Paracoccus luteus]